MTQVSYSGGGPRYYVRSGKFSIFGVVVMLVIGGVAAGVGGMIYAGVVKWIPFIYVNFIAMAGFGAVIGYAVKRVGRGTHLRNKSVAIGIGLLAGGFGLYVSWVFWSLMVLDTVTMEHVTYLFFHPADLWSLMGVIGEHGTWTLGSHSGGGDSVSGGFLWCLWFLEAVGIVGMAAYVAVSEFDKTPYCEGCKDWCVSEAGFAYRMAFTSPKGLVGAFEKGDFSGLANVPAPLGGGHTPYMFVSLFRCKGCDQGYMMRLSTVTFVKGKKGYTAKTKENMGFLRLDSNGVAGLMGAIAQGKAARGGGVRGGGG